MYNILNCIYYSNKSIIYQSYNFSSRLKWGSWSSTAWGDANPLKKIEWSLCAEQAINKVTALN